MNVSMNTQSGQPRNPVAVGVDIGARTTKVVALSGSAYGPVLRAAARIETPAEALREGVVVRRRETAQALRTLFQAITEPPLPVSLGVPTEKTLVRWIDLPAMDAESLCAATEFEARKYLPYPIDQAETRIVSWGTRAVGEENQMRALLVASPRDVVESRAETLEMAGCRVDAIEIEPFALLRALDTVEYQTGLLWKGQSMALMQLGAESSGMTVTQDGELRFVRAISWGSSRLIEMIGQRVGCSFSEAEELLESAPVWLDAEGFLRGAPQFEPDGLSVRAELERLHREIERLMSYYRSLYPERSYEGSLHCIALCGGLACLPGLDAYFASSLQAHVTTPDPLEKCLSGALFQEGKSTTRRHAPEFATAVGLAIGALNAESAGDNRRDRLCPTRVWHRKAA